MKVFFIKILLVLCFLFFLIHSFSYGYKSNTNKKEKGMISLPTPNYNSNTSIENALYKRRSIRSYKNEPLNIEEISQLLWAAYGITYKIENGPAYLRGGLKTSPSAGALYPLEIYIVAGNVTGLEPGIYRYRPQDHRLEIVLKGDKRKELCVAGFNQKMIKNAPADIVYSAIYNRTCKKYGKRGRERYVCMDLGHSAENIYLQAVSLNIGTCGIGAFSDIKVREVLNMPKEEEPLYIMPIGKLKNK
jgi:SagB-type dehydrogenase family enzyme